VTSVLAAYDALVAAGELRPDPEQRAAADPRVTHIAEHPAGMDQRVDHAETQRQIIERSNEIGQVQPHQPPRAPVGEVRLPVGIENQAGIGFVQVQRAVERCDRDRQPWITRRNIVRCGGVSGREQHRIAQRRRRVRFAEPCPDQVAARARAAAFDKADVALRHIHAQRQLELRDARAFADGLQHGPEAAGHGCGLWDAKGVRVDYLAGRRNNVSHGAG